MSIVRLVVCLVGAALLDATVTVILKKSGVYLGASPTMLKVAICYGLAYVLVYHVFAAEKKHAVQPSQASSELHLSTGTPTPHASSSESSPNAYCPACNNSIPADAAECLYCEAAFGSAAAWKPTQTPSGPARLLPLRKRTSEGSRPVREPMLVSGVGAAAQGLESLTPHTNPLQTLSFFWRLVLAGSAFWSALVLLFVWAFEPYGSHISDSEWWKIFKIIIFAPLVLTVGYAIARVFLRKGSSQE